MAHFRWRPQLHLWGKWRVWGFQPRFPLACEGDRPGPWPGLRGTYQPGWAMPPPPQGTFQLHSITPQADCLPGPCPLQRQVRGLAHLQNQTQEPRALPQGGQTLLSVQPPIRPSKTDALTPSRPHLQSCVPEATACSSQCKSKQDAHFPEPSLAPQHPRNQAVTLLGSPAPSQSGCGPELVPVEPPRPGLLDHLP